MITPVHNEKKFKNLKLMKQNCFFTVNNYIFSIFPTIMSKVKTMVVVFLLKFSFHLKFLLIEKKINR